MSSLGDSDVFLHDVVLLIDRHGCVARSTGKATSFPGSLFSASLVVGTETLVAAGHVTIYPSKPAGWVGTQVHLP